MSSPLTFLDDEPEHYWVMVVDDSAFIRGALTRAIEKDPFLHVVHSVSNGEQAVRSLAREPVDVIVLDIEMPIMDGLTALPKLKEIDGAVQIIMASTLTQKNAEISLRAMSLGATDYIPKPSSSHEVTAADDFQRELIAKVKALGALARRSGVREIQRKVPDSSVVAPVTAARSVPAPRPAQPLESRQESSRAPDVPKRATFMPLSSERREIVLRQGAIQRPDVLAIGSSTGGPQALFKVIRDMGRGLPQPIVITQHMPPSFTTILAEHIARQCDVVCTEGKDGDILAPGHYYIAPGDFHMLVEKRGGGAVIRLVKDPPENFCRPSVDPMLRSLAAVYGKKVLVAILTGMGSDGTKGGSVIVQEGGNVIAQDEQTSVVWGMPGSVAMAGLCSAILPVDKIGVFIRQSATKGV